MGDRRNPNPGLLPKPELSQSEGWRRNLGKSSLRLEHPRAADWWTGKPPEYGKCPGMTLAGKITALEMPNLATCTRQSVLDYFDNTWSLTEVLFSSLLGDEAFYRPPYHGLRHPLVFYYVHPAALYINKLLVSELILEPVNDYFERLFETGVDEMSWDDMSKNYLDWPAIDDLKDYRRQVYETVSRVIRVHRDLAPGHAQIGEKSQLWALFMGFEHERIHQETTSVLIRELPVDLVRRPDFWPPLHPSAAKYDREFRPPKPGEDYQSNDFLPVPAGQVLLGKPADWPTYGWDNEYGRRQDHVQEFSATRFLVSNAEFWQFVVAGGYQEKRFWSESGWSWRAFRNAKWPSFWYQDGPAGSHQYKLRTCFEIIPMPWSWPCAVNYHEALAYCHWRAERDGSSVPYRLITEAEHQRLRQVNGFEIDDRDQLIVPPPSNVNLQWGSESPVDLMDDSNAPFCDLFGNLWQWCEDHFNPLPQFKIHRFYDDFSTPCFDGQHQMIMGGSFASTGDEATPWARFHFRPHFFQHAGFRMSYSPHGSDGRAVRIGESAESVNPYESEEVLEQYLTLHYGAEREQMPYEFGPVDAARFPQRCAELVIEWSRRLDLPIERVLEIGCSVGGASFALAEAFPEVEAVDLSELFIATARKIQDDGNITFRYKEEGDLFTRITASVPASLRQRVNFRRADACSLPPEYVDFDSVLIANVLCRVPSPMACLSRMAGSRGVVRKGGLLVITSPFTWMERYTPRDVWLGGYIDEAGNPVFSEDGLARALRRDFELVEKKNMPLVIREHSRKYQYIVAQATVWRRQSN